jgi:phosphatidylglycerol:prolipoprotein diacylglycerol transferase
MYPTLHIGSFALSTHLLLNLLGAVVFGVWAWQRSRKDFPHFSASQIIDLTFYLFCGILGGALVAATMPYLVNALFGQPIPPLLWMGWQNWFGAVTGGALAGWLYARRHGYPLGLSFDLFAPLIPVALIFIRTGCLLAGDSEGKLTTHWPALVLPDSAGVWASRYPTQIVDILIGVVIASVLFSYDRFVSSVLKKTLPWPFAGFKFWLYVILFCGQRLYFEFWRADTPPLVGDVTWNHLYAALGLVLAVWVVITRSRK